MKILTHHYSPYSQDIWESFHEHSVHKVLKAPADPRIPLCPHYFSDTLQKKKLFFLHKNYPYLSLELILAGKMEFKTADRREICGPGEMYVITPGSTVRLIIYSEEPMHKISVLSKGTRAGQIVELFGFRESMKLKLSDPKEIERRMRQLGEMIRARKPPEDRALQGFALLMKLAGELQETEQPTGVLQAVQLMNREIANPDLNSEQLARYAGYSLADFRKKFYVVYGVSPMKYLMEERMKLARTLLETTPLRLKEIIERVGFNSTHSFSLTFRRICGCSPRQYRDRKMSPGQKPKKEKTVH